MNDNDEIKIFKPFGPPIGKFEIELDLVNRINKYIDKLVQDKEKSSELDAGKSLAGQVNQEIKFEKEFCEEFIIPTLINKIKYIYLLILIKKYQNTILKVFGQSDSLKMNIILPIITQDIFLGSDTLKFQKILVNHLKK